MITELLEIPERRNTVLPEIVRFFRRAAPGNDTLIHEFVRQFAGMQMEIPGPEMLVDVARDERIVREIGADQSPQACLKILKRYRITYSYLQHIWMAVNGRPLVSPRTTSEAAIEAAAALMVDSTRQISDIGMMFQLTATEQAAAIRRMKGRRSNLSRRLQLGAFSRDVIRTAARHPGLDREAMIKKMGRIPTGRTRGDLERALNEFQRQGVVVIVDGRIRLAGGEKKCQ